METIFQIAQTFIRARDIQLLEVVTWYTKDKVIKIYQLKLQTHTITIHNVQFLLGTFWCPNQHRQDQQHILYLLEGLFRYIAVASLQNGILKQRRLDT